MRLGLRVDVSNWDGFWFLSEKKLTIVAEEGIFPGSTLRVTGTYKNSVGLNYNNERLFYNGERLIFGRFVQWYINGIPIYDQIEDTFIIPADVAPGDIITAGDGEITSEPVTVQGSRIDFTLSDTFPTTFGGKMLTFARGSNATRFNSQGILETIAPNVPRIDYDSISKVRLGLLLESSKSNSCPRSQEFDHAAWVKSNGASVIANTAFSPDGTQNADELTFSAQFSQISQASLVNTAGSVVTVSVWIKWVSGNKNLFLRGFSSGIIYPQAITVTDKWVRYSATFTHDGTNNIGLTIEDRNNSNFGKVLVYGAQVELGSMTSYIPTVATGATRQSDICSVSTSSWFDSEKGAFYIEGGNYQDTATSTGRRYFFYLSDSGNNRLAIRAVNAAGSNPPYSVVGNGTLNSELTLGSLISSVEKHALAYSTTQGCRFSRNGAISAVGGLYSGFVHPTLIIGENLHGYIRKLDFFPKQLAAETIKKRTSIAIAGEASQGKTLTSSDIGQWNIDGAAISGQNDKTFIVPNSILPTQVVSQNGNTKKVAGALFDGRVSTFPTTFGDQPISFTRASSAIEEGASLLSLIGNDVRRNFYSNGVKSGELFESSATNLLINSNDFNASGWSRISSSVIGAAKDGPLGSLSASKLVASTSNSSHYLIASSISAVAGNSYVISCYAEAGEYTTLSLVGVSAVFGSSLYANFDLVNGVFNVSGTATNLEAGMIPMGNGRYRCWLRAQANSSGVNVFQIRVNSNYSVGALNYIGDDVSGIYIYGMSVTTGSLSTYIPTTASTVIRQADTLSIPTAGWFNPSGGLFIAKVRAYNGSATLGGRTVFDVGTISNRILIRLAQDNLNLQPIAFVGTGSTLQNAVVGSSPASSSEWEYLVLSYSTTNGSYFARKTGSNLASVSVNIANFSGVNPISMKIGENLDGYIQYLSYQTGEFTQAQVLAIANSLV